MGSLGLHTESLCSAGYYTKLDDPIIQGSREATEEEIEEAIMKELKMKGLLLSA